MRDLLEVVAELWSLPEAHLGMRLIGGLAVRMHVGPTARSTRDIDVVALTRPTRDAVLRRLEAGGWHVGAVGPWTRAARAGYPLLDIAEHPVVSPRTFDAVTLRAAPSRAMVHDVEVGLAGTADLALLKLVAQRDQDLIDLYFLAANGTLDARVTSDAAALDDIERSASDGAHRARHAVRSGALAAIIEEVTGAQAEPPGMARLERWLDDLEKDGI